MSEEVFKIIKQTNKNEVKMQLALQCSPLLAGLKLSNLLIINSREEARVRALFENSDIEVMVIYREAQKVTFFLYRPMELDQYLHQADVVRLLQWLGYKQTNRKSVLKRFRSRYRRYRQGRLDFPHEMGILLGYPVKDVYGFIVHKGKNHLYTGYWKIYDNLTETLKLFEKFNQAQERIVRQVYAGVSISEIIGCPA